MPLCCSFQHSKYWNRKPKKTSFPTLGSWESPYWSSPTKSCLLFDVISSASFFPYKYPQALKSEGYKSRLFLNHYSSVWTVLLSIQPSSNPSHRNILPTMFAPASQSILSVIFLFVVFAVATPAPWGGTPTSTVTVTATPTPTSAGNCNTGDLQCCNQVESVSAPTIPSRS